MRLRVTLVLVTVLTSGAVVAQERFKAADVIGQPFDVQKILRGPPRIPLRNEGDHIKNVNEVLDLVAEDLAAQKLSGIDVSRLRYVFLHSIPPHMRASTRSALPFWVNSMSRSDEVVPPQPVPNTEEMVYRLNIDDYEWTPEAWEKVSGQDPYLRAPVVQGQAITFIKQNIGNGVVRADWFIYHASDPSLTRTKADDAPYYVLTYARTKFTSQHQVRDTRGNTTNKAVVEIRPPRNGQEFRDVWGVSLKDALDFRSDRGAVVNEGDSGKMTGTPVAFNARLLRYVNGKIGYYWQTFDNQASVGDRDYAENTQNFEGEANEYIVQGLNHLQFYFLSDGQGSRVEFADPRIVRDTTDNLHRPLRNGVSCAICHVVGINPFRSYVRQTTEDGVENHHTEQESLRRFNRFHLSNVDKIVQRNQEDYAEAVERCNGLTPQENAFQFHSFRTWYEKPLDKAQICRELACTVDELDASLSVGVKRRLNHLLITDTPVPRTTWESGLYAESALLLMEYRKGLAEKKNKAATAKVAGRST